MRNLYQVYAYVTKEGWERSLAERWPDAPLIGEYRLLVFTNEDLPKIKEEYESADFKNLGVEGTIESMGQNEVGPFICSQSETLQIVNHFAPPDSMKTEGD